MQQARGWHQFERCLLEIAAARLRDPPAAGRTKQMGDIASLIGVGHERAEAMPLCGLVACLFEQLAMGRNDRGLSFLKCATGKAETHPMQPVLVLPEHRHSAVIHFRVDQDVVWQLDDVVIGDRPPIRELDALDGDLFDRATRENRLAAQRLPMRQVRHMSN